MLKFEDVRFDKIVFAGSILPRDFDWGLLFARDQVISVRNECGQKDPWPKWAGRLVAGTGTGGSEGFEWFGSQVENVRCEWYEHSDSLMQQHFEQIWIPFLRRAPSPLVLLHGRDIHDRQKFSDILDHTGTLIDDQAFGTLPNYVDVEIPRGLSLTWIRVNPDIYTFLIDRDSNVPAGYLNAMPVDDSLYAEIRAGKVADNQISAEGIESYLGPKKPLKIYMMSIAIDESYRRWGDGIFQFAYVQLLTGFLDKLSYYARNHGVRASHILATAWTPEGKKICESFGMTEIGKDRFNDRIFELDLGSPHLQSRKGLTPALKRLLKIYDRMQ